MTIPVIPAVLNITKIYAYLAHCSKSEQNEILDLIGEAYSPNGEVEKDGQKLGLVNSNAVSQLLQYFGPNGTKQDCSVPEIKGNPYPYSIKTSTGDRKAVYLFGKTKSDTTTLEDAKTFVSLEASLNPEERSAQLEHILAGGTDDYMIIHYRPCCGDDPDNLPLSVVTIEHDDGIMTVHERHSLQSVQDHGVGGLYRKGQNGSPEISYDIASKQGLQRLLGRAQHIKGEAHDCGGHPELSAKSAAKVGLLGRILGR